MDIKGKIKLIKETQTFESGFTKRELVLTTQEQYPQDILIEFLKDKTELLNNYNVGNEVTIGINLRGREWVNPQGESKYFNTIVGWKIFKQETANQSEKQPVEQSDDLPF